MPLILGLESLKSISSIYLLLRECKKWYLKEPFFISTFFGGGGGVGVGVGVGVEWEAYPEFLSNCYSPVVCEFPWSTL